MRYFVIIPFNLEHQVKAVLMANKDDVDYILEDNKIFISEFEAYRTGIPWLLSIIAPYKCLLRSMFYQFDGQPIDYYNGGYVYNTSSKANERIILTGYAGGVRKICGLISPNVYTWGNYSISFDSKTRQPYINYHKYSSDRKNIGSFSLSEFMNLDLLTFESKLNPPYVGGSDEFKAIKERLKDLIKIK